MYYCMYSLPIPLFYLKRVWSHWHFRMVQNHGFYMNIHLEGVVVFEVNDEWT